jgi:hypothetical protein
LDSFFIFSLSHRVHFVNSLELCWRLSGVVHSSQTKSDVILGMFVYNSDLYVATALSNGIVKAFESNFLVFLPGFADYIFNLPGSSSQNEEIFVSSKIVGISCSKSF